MPTNRDDKQLDKEVAAGSALALWLGLGGVFYLIYKGITGKRKNPREVFGDYTPVTIRAEPGQLVTAKFPEMTLHRVQTGQTYTVSLANPAPSNDANETYSVRFYEGDLEDDPYSWKIADPNSPLGAAFFATNGAPATVMKASNNHAITFTLKPGQGLEQIIILIVTEDLVSERRGLLVLGVYD